MAVRILGVNLKDEKPTYVALTSIFGIGQSTARKICKALSIDEHKRAKNLTDEEMASLQDEIKKKYIVEGDLRQRISRNINILKDIKCYRGTRHKKKLPAHGQRTKTNSRTVRGGGRKTVANKKEAKQQG